MNSLQIPQAPEEHLDTKASEMWSNITWYREYNRTLLIILSRLKRKGNKSFKITLRVREEIIKYLFKSTYSSHQRVYTLVPLMLVNRQIPLRAFQKQQAVHQHYPVLERFQTIVMLEFYMNFP